MFWPFKGHYQGAAELKTQIYKDTLPHILTVWGCAFIHFSL
jgi:hypothetical protein